MYFECWSPHPQTVDTELLLQRLAEYHYCLPEHMHGHADSAVNLLSTFRSNNNFTENRNTMQLNYTNHNILISINQSKFFMSLHMQPAWVRHVTLMSYDTTKKGTHRTHKSQLHAATANQNRPTGLKLQRLPQVIYHHLIVQPSWCFYSTLFLTQQGRSSLIFDGWLRGSQ